MVMGTGAATASIVNQLTHHPGPRPSRTMATDRSSAIESELELALWSDYVDKLAAWITGEFECRGIETLLLKGPAIARWLYADSGSRPYGDADVMVSPAQWNAAQSLLRELGFSQELAPLDHPGMTSFASESWVRGNENVDLHCTLWGLDVSPEVAWRALSRSPAEIELQGRRIRVLAPAARALLLATHAAKHGDGWALTDLEKGIAQLDPGIWRDAGALATELDAIPAFAAGMRLVGNGPEVVRALSLPDVPHPEASLRAWRVPMALGLEQLARTRGGRPKLVMVLRELAPNPAFMRWWTPLARRGRAGLVLAYIWRVIWMLAHAGPAIYAWRRARHGHAPAQARPPGDTR
jgi:hypothetical protein